jgi:hypothetical protein
MRPPGAHWLRAANMRYSPVVLVWVEGRRAICAEQTGVAAELSINRALMRAAVAALTVVRVVTAEQRQR